MWVNILSKTNSDIIMWIKCLHQQGIDKENTDAQHDFETEDSEDVEVLDTYNWRTVIAFK